MTVERVISEPMDQFPIGMRVLAVDDDPTCLLLLETLLRRCHYNVTTTSQAITALNLLRENKNKFDLVISDVHMPDMDGFKLLELVGLEMDLPVIMLSANGDTKLVMKGITHGACDYLLKPVRIEELRNIWQHVIRRKKLDSKDRYNSSSQDKPHFDSGEAAGIGNVDQGGKLNKKRKDQNEDEDNDNDDPSTQKKPRVVWSVELHRKFVAAVNQLGIDKAVPKKILELMNEEKLSRENVASHLQKFRLYLRRISCVANQQANMVAALGCADSSFLQMGSLNGAGNFHTLTGPDQLHNAGFRSFPPTGVLGRLNTPAGLGIPSPGMVQLSHVQNLGNTSNNQRKLQSFVIPGTSNASILHGMPISSELDQLQNNNGDGRSGQLPSVDNTSVFAVSGSYARGSNSSHLDVTSDSLMIGRNSHLATLHASNLRDGVSAIGFQNGSTLSDFTSIASASNQLQDQRQASPICYNVGQKIRSASPEWNVPKKDIPYQSNVPTCSLNSINAVNGDMAQLGQCLDQNNPIFNRNVGVNSVELSNFGYPMVQSSLQGSYIPDNIGSLDDLASTMMKRDQDKGQPADGDFGGNSYSLRTCI